MVKPAGTGSPKLAISARLAPLPPSNSFIFALPSAKPSPAVSPRFAALLGSLDARAELLDQPILGEADLRHRVAVAQRDRAVLHGVVIDGDTEGRADLVLAAVAPPDRARLIVVDREVLAERVVDAPCAL